MGSDETFMNVALQQARRALSMREFPVGCVIVSGGEIVAAGERQNSFGATNELDHAEINALRNLLSQNIEYDMSRLSVYSTMEPCLMCYSTLVVNGIRHIVYAYEDAMGGGTNLPLLQLSPLYAEIEMSVVKGVCREESLDLFQQFFRDPSNTYLGDTLLASYTLKQKCNSSNGCK